MCEKNQEGGRDEGTGVGTLVRNDAKGDPSGLKTIYILNRGSRASGVHENVIVKEPPKTRFLDKKPDPENIPRFLQTAKRNPRPTNDFDETSPKARKKRKPAAVLHGHTRERKARAKVRNPITKTSKKGIQSECEKEHEVEESGSLDPLAARARARGSSTKRSLVPNRPRLHPPPTWGTAPAPLDTRRAFIIPRDP